MPRVTTGPRVIVCGAGMAGLVAALSACEAGARVSLLERAPRIGGNMALSAGGIWTFSTLEQVQEWVPGGNLDLQRLVLDSLERSWEWLEEKGVSLSPVYSTGGMGLGKGRRLDPRKAGEVLLERILSTGGELITDTGLVELLVDRDHITGVRAESAGVSRDFASDSVVLATGGFQAGPDLVAEHIVPWGNLTLRSQSWSTGAAVAAGRRAGAALSAGLETFYGHAMTTTNRELRSDDFAWATQLYGNRALALDQTGLRFTDESEGTGEEVLNQDLARRQNGSGVYVLDTKTARETVHPAIATSIESVISEARTRGARVVRANTIEQLAERLGADGLPAHSVLRTIRVFNAAALKGHADELRPPRRRDARPLTEPPFYAVHVQAGISCTNGGLMVDTHMRVLSARPIGRSGSAIKGLFAAGSDVGALNSRGYMGGLACALVTGRLAGESSAQLY
jgi:succinate dehydrogenase/fumarate reductase flavoprotein subunit